MVASVAKLPESPINRETAPPRKPEVARVHDHLFGDLLLTATELNRKPGTVLDMAREQPITITRNDESFALMSRNVARQMTARWHDAVVMAELFEAILQCQKNELRPEHPYGWLQAFTQDERSELLSEVISLIKDAGDDLEPEEALSVSAIIHEWHESSLAMTSQEHARAFTSREEQQPTPLAEPTDSLPPDDAPG